MIALELFHGRKSPDEQLEDWGDQGPIFLLHWVHLTYFGNLVVGLPDGADEDMTIVGELLYYDEMFYGDWSVCSAAYVLSTPELASRIVEFDPLRAALPTEASCPT
jgi:hypothetical protein